MLSIAQLSQGATINNPGTLHSDASTSTPHDHARPASPILNHAHTPSRTYCTDDLPAIDCLSVDDFTLRSQISRSRAQSPTSENRFVGLDKGKGKARNDELEEGNDQLFPLRGDDLRSRGSARGRDIGELYYRAYSSEEEDLAELMRLVEEELSEPYVSPSAFPKSMLHRLMRSMWYGKGSNDTWKIC